MKILSFSLIVLSVTALFAVGIMTTIMTIQTAEAKSRYCPTDNPPLLCPAGKDAKKTCESIYGKGECEKTK